ncbi:tyrosine-protein phosphatase [Aldersonia sp. NBC_00410]|uniref:tyrosine-protein phosphatase n=1 Tax=Aldersonia sp. NBC_00410 TaxID=2975954 RepID=UPI00224DB368|nr:tyrosine-protein phosphatase [Aldersonia sp. NBC_00410]MCX5046559.1 tyrosine-protein phosphatase [Aldersonia sp. NBC_00410]
MTRPSDAPLEIAGLPNLRDVGGWPTTDGGRVRRGMLYRSVELNRLDDDGVTAFAALGIRTVYDLRTEVERVAQPDRLPEGTAHVVADVLAETVGAASAQMLEFLEDPGKAVALLTDGVAETALSDSYRHIVSSGSALHAYRRLYTGLADPRSRPALLHCTTGKDRTGWGAAALLLLLRVSEQDVLRDYLLTNEELLPALAPIFEKFEVAGGDPAMLRPLLGVQESYLRTALDEMNTRFGDIEGYFRRGLGLDGATLDTLREAFVEPA